VSPDASANLDLEAYTYALPPAHIAQHPPAERDAGRLMLLDRGDGSVGPTAPFPADVGDNILVTFEAEDQLSSACVVLAVGQPSPCGQ